MTTQNSDKGAYVALGALFGVAAGIGAGMLLAPRSGVDTRNRIRTRAMSAKQSAQHRLATGRDKAMDTLNKSLEKSKDMIDKANDKTQDTMDKVSTRAKDAADQAQEETEKSRSRRNSDS